MAKKPKRGVKKVSIEKVKMGKLEKVLTVANLIMIAVSLVFAFIPIPGYLVYLYLFVPVLGISIYNFVISPKETQKRKRNLTILIMAAVSLIPIVNIVTLAIALAFTILNLVKKE